MKFFRVFTHSDFSWGFHWTKNVFLFNEVCRIGWCCKIYVFCCFLRFLGIYKLCVIIVTLDLVLFNGFIVPFA